MNTSSAGRVELEVMRDRNDNVVIICALRIWIRWGFTRETRLRLLGSDADRRDQYMRDAALACIREIGVDTGGSNVSVGVCPGTGRVIIEMNPRVSRFVCGQATDYPIAKIAHSWRAHPDEITNDITQTTPASFEPTIDYVYQGAPIHLRKVPSHQARAGHADEVGG